MLVEWKDDYSVGFDVIDSHHKKLLDILNQSYFMILEENNDDKLFKLLEELFDYAKYHFSAEEELMRCNDYKDIDKHLIEHFSFINQVLTLKNEIAEGNKYISIEVFDFVKNWLLNHILEVDSEMGRSMRFKQAGNQV